MVKIKKIFFQKIFALQGTYFVKSLLVKKIKIKKL
jgi:hypothetical protein